MIDKKDYLNLSGKVAVITGLKSGNGILCLMWASRACF